MVEEVNLVVLGGAQDRRADEDGGDVQGDACRAHHEEYGKNREQRRDHRCQQCGRAAKHRQKGEENHACREHEALGKRGQQTLGDLSGKRSLAGEAAAHVRERRVLRLRRAPRAFDECAHRSGRAEQSTPPADREPDTREIRDVDVAARAGFGEQDLLEIGRKLRPVRGCGGQSIVA